MWMKPFRVLPLLDAIALYPSMAFFPPSNAFHSANNWKESPARSVPITFVSPTELRISKFKAQGFTLYQVSNFIKAKIQKNPLY